MTGQSTAPASRRRRILPRTFESDEALLAAYRAALDRVPTLTRVVFLLHRIDDLAFDDIARRLSIEVVGGRLREGAESYAKLAQIAGARSYLLLPSTVAPERRRLSSIRRWLRILKVSGPTRRY